MNSEWSRQSTNNRCTGQANKWVKNLEKENRLQVIKLTDSNYLRIVELAIQYGTPVLLENISEDIDPSLGRILIQSNPLNREITLCVTFRSRVVKKSIQARRN